MLEYAKNARSKPKIGIVNEEWNTNESYNFSKCRIGNPFLGKMIDAMAHECSQTSTESEILIDNQHVKPRSQSSSLLNQEVAGINQIAQISQSKRKTGYSQYSGGSKETPLSPKKRLEKEQSNEKIDQPSLEALSIENSVPLKSDWIKMSIEYKNKIDTVKSLVEEMDAKFKQIQENPDFVYLSSSSKPIDKIQGTQSEVIAQKNESVEDRRRMTRRAWWVEDVNEADNE